MMKNIIDELHSKLHRIVNSYAFRCPLDLVRRREQEIDFLISGLLKDASSKLQFFNSKVSILKKSLEAYNTNKVLERGFVLVKQNSRFVTKAAKYSKDDPATLQFSDGNIKVHT
jgi:exodeoxyribonuclease VII large subunit